MTDAEGPAADSAERWRDIRRLLSRHRPELTAVASRLYPAATRVGSTPLLCRAGWQPARPLNLDDLTLDWIEQAAAPQVDGTGPASAPVRPGGAAGRFPTYADAIAAIDPPAVFDNRPCYRLLAADLAGQHGRLGLTRSSYFDGVSIGEAVGHELAAAWAADPASLGPDRLPLRQAVGDPCDLTRRSVTVAITTLTLRRTAPGAATFLLHWRDPAKVTHAGGLYQVVPVGVFQPADDTPAAERSDLSLWRCMVREFSEELLGTAEDYADLGTPLDYDRWARYRRLSAARQAGRLRVSCLGLGVDPVTLATDILTVAVFDSDLFDAEFDGLVAVNAEGRLLGGRGDAGLPFTGDVVARFADGSEPVQAAGAAVLQLAWRHREYLLG